MLAHSSTAGLAALVGAIKDGTVPESSYKMIGKLPEESLSHLIKAIISDESPGHLFQCLAVFYTRAAPLLLRDIAGLSATQRRDFYDRLAASAASAKDARLFDLLGLLHLKRGELDSAIKHFFECVNMKDCPETAVHHLKEALMALERFKSTESRDQLFTTFI